MASYDEKFIKATKCSKKITKKSSTAFTLAEVLIALGVIGVVAAITLPSMIKNYQKDKTLTQLKKVYTILNQGTKLAEAEYGDYKYWDSPVTIGAEEYYKKYYEPYYKKVKNCATYAKCGYAFKPFYNINGTNSGITLSSQRPKIIFADGTILIDMLYTSYSNGKMGNYPHLIVDLNGSKKPNTLGKDVFVFYRFNKGVLPADFGKDYDSINNNCIQKGYDCAAKIMKDNWKMKDDYPW